MALTAEQWDRIEALLPEALELAPTERPRFLDRHCPAELRAEVEAMIAASAAGRGALDRPVGLTAPEEAGQSLQRGAVLGAWRIDSLLGSGGMGEVYAAERADGSYEQRVALKLLKRGVDTQAVLSRFLRERRILARLAHPNIARLLDAGAAPDGRPYLVMERVDGLPIDQWCRRQAASLRRRLELMCQVCEAVYAAHREQIVHRDLKPSNVLVSAAGEAKLLDFGVSKLADEESGDRTQTALGIAPLTLDYAAPEQLQGQPASPATDVYALGLLLYRLLTGALPHARSSLAAALATAGRDERITRPSELLRRSAALDAAAGPARELDGDLDQIVLKALQRDPARRYANAAELADDLRRHLDGRPVLARPDSRWYVARKFVARNRVPVAAGVAVALALVVGIAVALWQARVAERRADQLRTVVEFQGGLLKRVNVYKLGAAWSALMRERIAGKLEKDHPFDPAQGQAMLESFDRLLPLSQPSELARETLGEYVLAPARAEIGQRFAAEPSIAGQLHESLGQAYEDIGLYKDAIAEFQEAIAAQTAALGLDAPETLSSRLKLAAIEMEAHDPKAAAAAAKAVLDARLRILGADNRDTQYARRIYAHTLATQDYTQALALAKSNVETDQRLFGADDPDTLKAEKDLADILYSKGDYAESIPLTRQLLEAARKRWGNEDRTTLQVMNSLAGQLQETGANAEARKLNEEALAIRRRTLGDDHPDTLQSLGNLATVLTTTGPRPLAYRMTKELYLANQRVLDEGNRRRLSAANNYAQLLEDRGDYLGACRLGQRVLELRTRNTSAEDRYTLHSLEIFGALLAYQKQYAAARAKLGQALEADRRTLGPDHPQTLEAWAYLGESMLLEGDWAAALKELTAAGERQRSVLGAEDPNTLQTVTDIARAQRGLGRLEEARKGLEANLAVQRRVLGEASPAALATAAELAQALHGLHREAEAQKLAQSVLEAWRGQADGPSWDVIEAERALATIDEALGQGADARELQRDTDSAEQALRISFAADERETGVAMLASADELCSGGKHPAASSR